MTAAFLSALLFLGLLGTGLLLPGWLLSRMLNTPGEPSTAFLGSAALLFNLILLLDALNISLTASHLAIGLAVICSVFFLGSKLREEPAAKLTAGAIAFSWKSHRGWLLPTAIGLAAIAIKALVDPLSGLDTFFRWDFLARQMVQEACLHFYPPYTSADFLHYGWCDGIAPLISDLYFWAYLSAGDTSKWATAPVVIGEALLLFGAVYQLAAIRGGGKAGCAAMALLAINPVLLWGVAMGQETGLTAISLIAMFLFIERHRASSEKHWLIWAGIAAGTGALAREYGLAFIGLGAVALAWHRTSRRGWLEFTIAAAFVAFPWYARNWFRTGNPLYSQTLGGIFPVNPVHAEYFQLTHEGIRLPTIAAMAVTLTLLLVKWTGLGLVVGVAGLIKAKRDQIPWIIALIGLTALWFWSIGYTSGGLVYSLRVMTPAIALAAVAGAPVIARLRSVRHGWVIVIIATILAIDAAERSRFMPFPSQVVWWKKPPSSWLQFSWLREPWTNDPHWAAVASAAKERQVLVSSPYCFAIMIRLGAHPVPVFSPAVRRLFAPDARLGVEVARLRSDGMRFVLITKDDGQLALHPFFASLQATRATMDTPDFMLYDLDQVNAGIDHSNIAEFESRKVQ